MLNPAEVRVEPAIVEGSIGGRFAQIATQFGDRLAISSSTVQWTYAQLDAHSDRLAREMENALAGEADGTLPVALLMEHDAPLIAAILAAAKIGRPCVVLDEADSPARRSNTFSSSGAPLLVVDAAHEAEAMHLTGGGGSTTLNVTAVATPHGDVAPTVAPASRVVTPDTIASITFTSGTTGRPKGVCHSHQTVLHHCRNYTLSAELSPPDRISLLTPCHLAASRSSLWGALLNGAALFPLDLRTRGVNELPDWIEQQALTVLHCVPVVFRTLASFLSSDDTPKPLRSLRLLRLGGESIYASDFELFKLHTNPSCKLLVGFSSTETGLTCQAFFDHHSRVNGSALPMGLQAPGMRVEILDDDRRPLRRGEVGRIVVSSRYLAQGYWRDAELSASRFGIDPEDHGSRRFDTGDLGIFDEEGRLLHCGRADDRLKIRGHRVDPAEVEGTLLSLDSIRDAAVVSIDDAAGDSRLVAYVVATPESFAGTSVLRRRLREQLPAHMIPSDFVQLDHLPRTAAGKINRPALPRPQAKRRARDDGTIADRGEGLEAKLTELWEDVLGAGEVNPDDDFFLDLGATSLQSATFIVRLGRMLDWPVSLSALMQCRTSRELAAHLERSPDLTQPSASASSLVVVQPGRADRTPFFFVHGDMVGAGLYCPNLTRGLGMDQPFYALAPLGFDGRPGPRSIEGMARQYVKEIRAMQPEGPYLLGGFCNGGVTAFEIARQLQQAGEPVKFLALIRARVGQVRWPGIRRAMHDLLGAIGIDSDRETDAFWRIHDHLLRFHQHDALADRAANLPELWERFRAKLVSGSAISQRATQSASNRTRPASDPADPLTSEIMHVHHRAMRSYLPRSYHGRIHLFWPEEDLPLLRGDRSAGWSRFAGDLVTQTIPGGHYTCLTTHHAELSRRLKPILQAAQRLIPFPPRTFRPGN